MKKQAAHIATAAVGNQLSKSGCKECPRNAPFCRHKTPLNGDDAAAEFTRNLMPWARERVVGSKES